MNTDAEHIAYARRDGRTVHVSEVDRGIACSCNCIACGAPLIARKGLQRRHHFAHFGDSNCEGALETVLHKLAKEILENATRIALPPYVFRRKSRARSRYYVDISQVVLPGQDRLIKWVTLERPMGTIIPDAYLLTDHGPLLVEVLVTHAVDRKKVLSVRRLDIPLLEIRLGADDAILNRQELSERILDDPRNKTWHFHPNQREIERDWLRMLRAASGAEWARRHLDTTIKPKLRAPHAGQTAQQSDTGNWKDFNTWGEWFYRQYGRYPSLDETRSRATPRSESGPEAATTIADQRQDPAKSRT